MQRSIKTQIWIYLCILIGYQTVAVPIEYDIMETDREISFDFDTEQSQARYDPRLLSEELRDIHSLSQERAASCLTSSVRYEHGEKVTRSDPCEMCLCVDGEIFCWWKKCDHNSKQKKQMLKNTVKNSRNLEKLSVERKKNHTKFKKMKLIPKKILSFPRHLPATLHYELTSIENTEITHGEDKVSPDEFSSALLVVEQRRNRERSTRRPFAILNVGDVNDEHNNNHAVTVPTKGHEEKNKYQDYANIPNNLYPNIYEEAKTNLRGVFKQKHTKMNDLNNDESSTELKRNRFVQPVLNSNKTSITTSRKGNNSANHQNNGINEENDADDVDDNGIQRKSSDRYQNEKIQFVDVPLAKHYIITSSGSVENADILASDNVLSQFRSGYSIVTSDPKANILLADGIVSDALQKKASTSTNYVVDPALIGTLVSLSTAVSEAPVAETNPTVAVTAIVLPKSSNFISSASHHSPLSSPSPSSLSSPLFLREQRSGLSTPQADTTQEPPQRQCIVMGKSYEIGTVLPQDTGNCLQCICIDGTNVGDPPRVTCSPHNCPPLVLPDLFDTTGY